MFFIRFLQVTAGTRDGTGQSYEETREAIYQNKPSNHHQLQFLYLKISGQVIYRIQGIEAFEQSFLREIAHSLGILS
jgi:hypothetical protein